MTNALLVAALSISVAPDVRVEMLGGPPVAGTLVGLDLGEVVVAEGDRESSVSVDKVLRIRLSDSNPNEPTAPWVELRDGSTVPVIEYSVDGKKALLTRSDMTAPISVPIEEIALVRLQSPTTKTRAQWRELRLAPPPADLLVVRRADAIDYLAGVLGDVTDTDVLFTLDGDKIPVPRRKIDGLLYYRGVAADLPESPCLLTTDDGLRLAVQQLVLGDRHIRATTASGVHLDVPVERVVSIDFSSNKLRYLGDLEPQSQMVVPLIGLSNRSEILGKTNEPMVDRGFFSDQLEIRTPVVKHGRQTWKVAAYDRGLALRSRTELEYRIPKEFARFVAVAGIDAALGGRGEVRLSIQVDGKTVFDEFVRGEREPIALDLDISGSKRLVVVVDFGEHGDAGDRLYLCDARITK